MPQDLQESPQLSAKYPPLNWQCCWHGAIQRHLDMPRRIQRHCCPSTLPSAAIPTNEGSVGEALPNEKYGLAILGTNNLYLFIYRLELPGSITSPRVHSKLLASACSPICCQV